MGEDEFRELKNQYHEAEKAASEARGAIRSLRERLKKEFGLGSIEEARKQLSQMKKSAERLRTDFEADLARYQEEFGREDK